MNNLSIYEKYRVVPEEAKKTIGGGKLKGMTDINPMWRIKCLTEQFGPCGFGWYYDVDKEWTETVDNEICAFVDISLYVKLDGEWSKAIRGTGGSKLATVDKNGRSVSDECFKMATTDALSVACKQLGFGADVYWNKDNTKYTKGEEMKAVQVQEEAKKTVEENTLQMPQRLEMMKFAKEKYPDGSKPQEALLKCWGIDDIGKATDVQLYTVWKKYHKE